MEKLSFSFFIVMSGGMINGDESYISYNNIVAMSFVFP